YVNTDLQEGYIKQFIDKENKYFQYIKGVGTYFTSNTDNNLDSKEFPMQGIGRATIVNAPAVTAFNVRVFANPGCAVYILPPSANAKTYTVLEDCTTCGPVTLTGSDPQGLSLTFEIQNNNVTNGTLSALSGNQITFTPNVPNYNGSAGSFTYRSFNGTIYSEPATVTINISSVIEPPNIDETNLPTGPFLEGDPYSWTGITATDPDHNPATELTWSATDLPPELTLTTTGEGFTGTASITGVVPAGTTTYTLRVTDPDNAFDEVVVSLTADAPPSCPSKTFVLQVCNSNSSRDDNFDVFLNGSYIGALDLNQNAQIGSVFIGDLDTNVGIGVGDFTCPLSGMVTYHFNPSILLGGTNTIFMQNTQNNGNGNLGTFQIRNYETDANDANSLINPCVVANTNFGGGSGLDQTITFEYTECCPE
ncbi:MAG: hypothetical protein R8K21_08395, partial [Mariprofundales bacterium]